MLFSAIHLNKEPSLEGLYTYRKKLHVSENVTGKYSCVAANRGTYHLMRIRTRTHGSLNGLLHSVLYSNPKWDLCNPEMVILNLSVLCVRLMYTLCSPRYRNIPSKGVVKKNTVDCLFQIFIIKKRRSPLYPSAYLSQLFFCQKCVNMNEFLARN